MPGITSTTVAAWYGAGVSTLAFGVSAYVAFRDRSRLKISVQANMKTFGSIDRFIAITVANTGRRTITVSKVAVTQRGKEHSWLLNSSLQPTEIAEGKAVTYGGSQAGFPLATAKRIHVFDLTGRKWTKRVPRSVRRAGKGEGQ